MSRGAPAAGCHDVALRGRHRMDEAGEVAFEDYARALTRSTGAEAVRDPDDAALVTGIHLCGLDGAPSAPHRRDLEDFARGLAGTPAGGLGWS